MTKNRRQAYSLAAYWKVIPHETTTRLPPQDFSWTEPRIFSPLMTLQCSVMSSQTQKSGGDHERLNSIELLPLGHQD